MTSRQALNSYYHIKGVNVSEERPLTLREKFKKYLEDNAYFFISASAMMSGNPMVFTDKLLLKGLNEADAADAA